MKKIASILSLVGLLTACGDETQLSRYVAEPMPRSSEVQRYDYMPPDYNNDSPGLSLNVTMQHCLGPLTDALSDLEILCPIARATGVCDPEFEGNLSGLPERVMEIIREEVPFINPFDLLDGEISIPVTALVSARTGVISSGGSDTESAASYPLKKADFVIVFGDRTEEINHYLNSELFASGSEDYLGVSQFPYGNFPMSHLRCVFSSLDNDESYTWQLEHVVAGYVKVEPETKEREIIASLEFRYTDYADINYSPRMVMKTELASKLYMESNFNINTLKYAVEDIAEDGIQRAIELLDNEENKKAIFLWD
jgi:hypothetical protein